MPYNYSYIVIYAPAALPRWFPASARYVSINFVFVSDAAYVLIRHVLGRGQADR